MEIEENKEIDDEMDIDFIKIDAKTKEEGENDDDDLNMSIEVITSDEEVVSLNPSSPLDEKEEVQEVKKEMESTIKLETIPTFFGVELQN